MVLKMPNFIKNGYNVWDRWGAESAGPDLGVEIIGLWLWSIALQRGNAVSFLSTFTATD